MIKIIGECPKYFKNAKALNGFTIAVVQFFVSSVPKHIPIILSTYPIWELKQVDEFDILINFAFKRDLDYANISYKCMLDSWYKI